MESVELQIKKTRINIVALVAWFAFFLGVIAAIVQLYQTTAIGVICAAVGLVGGGIAASNAGPVRTVSYHKVRGHKVDSEK